MAYKVKNFTGPNADERAWRFGMFCIAVSGNKKALDFCKADGMALAFLEDPDRPESAGSILVPAEFIEDLAILRRKYGLFRADATCLRMESDCLEDPRRNGSKTLMVAKMRYTQFGYLGMDCERAAEIGDGVIDEIAYSLSLKEDQCGFFGNGCSDYGGIVGFDYLLRHHGSANGLVIGQRLGFTLANLNKTVSLENAADLSWYCSNIFRGTVMLKLLSMCGADTRSPMDDPPSFLGFPIKLSPVFPRGYKPGELVCIAADLKRAAILAYRDRTALQITSELDRGHSIVKCFDESDVVIDNLDFARGLLSYAE